MGCLKVILGLPERFAAVGRCWLCRLTRSSASRSRRALPGAELHALHLCVSGSLRRTLLSCMPEMHPGGRSALLTACMDARSGSLGAAWRGVRPARAADPGRGEAPRAAGRRHGRMSAQGLRRAEGAWPDICASAAPCACAASASGAAKALLFAKVWYPWRVWHCQGK